MLDVSEFEEMFVAGSHGYQHMGLEGLEGFGSIHSMDSHPLVLLVV